MKKIIIAIVSRTDYIESLYKILLKHYHEYDECHLWLNTNKDTELYKTTFVPNNKIQILEHPPSETQTQTYTFTDLNYFYKTYAIDDDSIYIKIDDDMVWFEDNFFSKLFDYRIKNTNNFLIYPLIINNAILTNILVRLGKFEWDNTCWYNSMDPVGWGSGTFAERLHNKFLESIVNNTYQDLRFDKWMLDWKEQVSINTIAFFGKDMKLATPTLNSHTDEHYLTYYAPAIVNKQNMIYGQFICAHYSFQPQRLHLDTTDIKDRYAKLYH